MKAIHIEIIPHETQRYETCGDWWWEGDTLQMRVSKIAGQNGWKIAMCVAIHELTEALLCKARGITQEQVDTFDMGIGENLDEPGDDPRAPYHREHRAAYIPEYMLLNEFDIPLADYNKALDSLGGEEDK